MEKTTCLKTHTLLVQGHTGDWPKFINPIHKGGWSCMHELPKASVWVLQSAHHQSIGDTSILPSLGRRIVDEKLSWGDDIEFAGEAHYIKGYWEWIEDILSRYEDILRELGIYDSVYTSLFTYDRNTDIIKAFCKAWCPSTNTLLTSVGELSISLWDLHVLSGLPANGTLYDEMVPRADELIGDRRGKLYLPTSCKHLFHAYHFLRSKCGNSNSTVSVEDWIKFWARKVMRYNPRLPLARKRSLPRARRINILLTPPVNFNNIQHHGRLPKGSHSPRLKLERSIVTRRTWLPTLHAGSAHSFFPRVMST